MRSFSSRIFRSEENACAPIIDLTSWTKSPPAPHAIHSDRPRRETKGNGRDEDSGRRCPAVVGGLLRAGGEQRSETASGTGQIVSRFILRDGGANGVLFVFNSIFFITLIYVCRTVYINVRYY